MSGLGRFASRLARARDGGVAMLFALAMPPLLLMTVAGVDIHRASTVRMNLQDALDAAALAAARSTANDDEAIRAVALPALRANLQAYPDIELREDLTTFELTEDGVVIASSKVDVRTLVANIVLPPYGKFAEDKLLIGTTSEVNRSSRNLEVALVLDITGSMTNGRIEALKEAADELVDIVVQAQQSPFYSKMSIVPYSMGVNVDGYASTARGTPTGSADISSITWHKGAVRNVSNVTRANWATVTASNHGFQNGDKVVFWDSRDMGELNGRVFTVANRQTNSFRLSGVDSRDWDRFDDDDDVKVAECSRSDCKPTVTASGHGLVNNATVYLTGIEYVSDIDEDMERLDDEPFSVSGVSGSTYLLNTVGMGPHVDDGRSWCGAYGCTWRVFTNPYGDLRALKASSCVSERTGGNAYTDAYTSSAKVGFNYAPDGNECPESTLMPLSSNISALKSKIDGLEIRGSTAGHIGAAWGWYSVSPNFSAMWPSSAAGAYDPDRLLKAVILMTDGEFNTPYCSGVIAQNAGAGSGGYEDKIACNGTNGSPFSQAEALCAGMRAQGIVVYTVGFQVAEDGEAAEIMRECASSPDYAFLPTDSDDLAEAFRAIGRDITRLRISK